MTALPPELVSDGYTFLPGVIDPDACARLREWHDSTGVDTSTAGVWLTLLSFDEDYRGRVLEVVRPELAGKLPAFFADYELRMATFFIKTVGPEGRFPLHRDASLVDERLGPSYGLWLALTPASANRGALQVVPRSHLESPPLRPFLWRYDVDPSVRVKAPVVTMECQPGDAVLFDHRLIHASRLNDGPGSRYSLSLVYMRREAQPLLGVLNDDRRHVDSYRTDFDKLQRRFPLNMTIVGDAVSRWDVREDERIAGWLRQRGTCEVSHERS